MRQFVFVSHNTVPLKSYLEGLSWPIMALTSRRGFDYVYKQLVSNSPFTSKFCSSTC